MDLLKRFRYLLFPPLFAIRVSGGTVRLVRGTVTPGFLRDFQAVVSASGTAEGRIWGRRTPVGTRLDFSPGIRREDRQRFRNVTGVHR